MTLRTAFLSGIEALSETSSAASARLFNRAYGDVQAELATHQKAIAADLARVKSGLPALGDYSSGAVQVKREWWLDGTTADAAELARDALRMRLRTTDEFRDADVKAYFRGGEVSRLEVSFSIELPQKLLTQLRGA